MIFSKRATPQEQLPLYTPDTTPEAKQSSELFQEPFSGDLHDRYYGAVPANPYLNQDVKDRQAHIEQAFAILFEHPPAELAIPDSFRKLLIDDYHINVQRRRMINYENFAKWRVAHPTLENSFLESVAARVETGRAESGDVLDLALHTDTQKLRGLEVGRVSHPYWRRTEYITPMRLDIAKAIIDRGGGLYSLETPYRRIKIAPKLTVNQATGEREIAGLLVRYKKDMGFIPRADGSILKIAERQIAGYRVDPESGFDQSILERMQAYTHSKKDFQWDYTSDEDLQTALKKTGCKEYVEQTVQTDTNAPFVVPESTTIYCYTEKETLPNKEIGKKAVSIAFRKPDSDEGIAFFDSNK